MKHQILTLIFAIALSTSASVTFAGDITAGKAKSVTCTACHGADGISVIPSSLAGQKEAYLAKAMKDFRSRTRSDPTMNAMAAPLSDADIANLAAYYASL